MSLWKVKTKIDPDIRKELKDHDEITAQLLFNRGIKTEREAERFLSPSEKHINDPGQLGEIKKAVKRILKAIDSNEKIYIHGDFDADGVTAATILWEYLYKDCKADVMPYIPHKADEGYGLNKTTLARFAKDKIGLLITVDCGIRDVELIQKYQGNPYDIIITDHHEIGDKLPNAYAVVHPGHPKYKYPFSDISGAVVAWKLAYEIERQRSKENPEWGKLRGSDLVAMSTVCDVMPLIEENRAIVHIGLERMRKSARPGIKFLADYAGINQEEIESYHLGFILGPRINAAGRLDHALKAVRLLSTEDPDAARRLAKKLNNLNERRQKLTEEILELAEAEVSNFKQMPNIIIIQGEGWPEGIVGLIAGRITEKYYRPSIVFSNLGNGKNVGSARSIPEFNIIEAISGAGELIERYGGHAQAAGLTVADEVFDDFKEQLSLTAQKLSPENLIKKYEIDVETKIGSINFRLIEGLDKFKPFGYGNPRPTFLVKNARIVSLSAVGDGRHIKAILSDNSNGRPLSAIGFYMADKFGDIAEGDEIEAIGYLEINEFGSKREIQLKMTDITKVEE